MASLLIPPPEDPVRAAAQWLGEAEALGRRNANAMALASVDERRPAVRAHGAAQGARAARLRRVLHELRLAQERRAVVDGPGRGRAVLARARPASSLRRARRALAGSRKRRLFREPAAAEPSQRVEQRAEPPAPRSRGARGARRQDRRHQTAPIEGSRAPTSGADSGLWLEAVELWVEGRDRFHERVRYQRRLDARDAYTFEPGRWSSQRLQP